MLTMGECRKGSRGQAVWTLRLLATELIALNIVESISAPKVMRTQKNELKPRQQHVLGDFR